MKASVMDSLGAMSDAELAALARKMAHYRAEDFVKNAMRETSEMELRSRARKVLHELRKIPFKGPIVPLH